MFVIQWVGITKKSLTGDFSEPSVLFRKIPRPSVAASENLPTPFVPQLESIRETSVTTAYT